MSLALAAAAAALRHIFHYRGAFTSRVATLVTVPPEAAISLGEIPVSKATKPTRDLLEDDNSSKTFLNAAKFRRIFYDEKLASLYGAYAMSWKARPPPIDEGRATDVPEYHIE